MADVNIAKARVIGVEEVKVKSQVVDGVLLKETSVIASKLLISPLENSNDPRMNCHGTITVPSQLPFGKNFTLVLRDTDSALMEPTGRVFKEEN